MGFFQLYKGLEAAVKNDVGAGATVDPASLFIAATGIIDETQKSAIQTLVAELIDAGLWDLITVLYPIISGNAPVHSYNLKDVIQNQVVWVGTPTHSNTGVNYNGSTQYGRTGYVVPAGNGHMGVYIRDDLRHTNQYDLGATTDDITYNMLNAGRTVLNAIIGAVNSTRLTIGIGTITDTRGFALITKPSGGTSLTAYKNGIITGSGDPEVGVPPTDEIYLGGVNSAGSLAFASTREAAFYTFGADLTPAQVLSYYNIIQTYQTTLARNV